MLYYNDKNWNYFIKEYLEQCSKFAFQKLLAKLGNQTYFEKFTSPWMQFGCPKPLGKC